MPSLAFSITLSQENALADTILRNASSSSLAKLSAAFLDNNTDAFVFLKISAKCNCTVSISLNDLPSGYFLFVV